MIKKVGKYLEKEAGQQSDGYDLKYIWNDIEIVHILCEGKNYKYFNDMNAELFISTNVRVSTLSGFYDTNSFCKIYRV